MSFFAAKNISVRFGGIRALSSVGFTVAAPPLNSAATSGRPVA